MGSPETPQDPAPTPLFDYGVLYINYNNNTTQVGIQPYRYQYPDGVVEAIQAVRDYIANDLGFDDATPELQEGFYAATLGGIPLIFATTYTRNWDDIYTHIARGYTVDGVPE